MLVRVLMICLLVAGLAAQELRSASGALVLTLPNGWATAQNPDPEVQTAVHAEGGNNLVLFQSTMTEGPELVASDLTEAIAAEFRELYPAARVVRSTYVNAHGTPFTIYTAVLGTGYVLKTNVVFCADSAHLYKIILTTSNSPEAKQLLERLLAAVNLAEG